MEFVKNWKLGSLHSLRLYLLIYWPLMVYESNLVNIIEAPNGRRSESYVIITCAILFIDR